MCYTGTPESAQEVTGRLEGHSGKTYRSIHLPGTDLLELQQLNLLEPLSVAKIFTVLGLRGFWYMTSTPCPFKNKE